MKPFYSLKLLILIALLAGWNQSSIAQLTTLSYTGAVQTFTVPAGVTVISVDMQGARGGANYFGYSQGGMGGRTQCLLAVTGGQVLQVYVGGQGNTGPTCCIYGVAGGFNGGGNSQFYYGGSGGGATDIRTTAGVLASRLVVAGAGGGAGYYTSTTGADRGGCGGGLIGEKSWANNTQSLSTCYNAGGGTQTAGGVNGTCGCNSSGGLGVGGLGSSCIYSGGGGGGYYGGGGGYYAGGGGGSSYTDATLCSSVTHTQCYNSTGNGVCNIYVPPAGGTASPGALSFGPIVVGSSSTAQTFSLVAYNLSPASGNLTVTPPSSFLVSVDGGVTYSSVPVSLPYSSGGITATIYVKFAPLTYSIFSGSILNVTGGGIATPITELLNGQGVFPCTGTPTSGAAAVSPTSGNTATPFTLSVPTASFGGGITYQWQMWSFAAGGFTNIVGANTATYIYTGGITANTYFRCIVSCPGGGSSISGSALATVSPAATNCTGLPNAGVVTTPTAAGCFPSFTTGVYLTGVSVAPGIKYNWQTSTDNVNWTTVAGATDPYYFATVSTSTYIRDSVTCTNSLLANFSAPQLLTVNPLPTPITGGTSICTPNPSFLTSTPSGGSWLSANPSIASVIVGTGVTTGITAGATTVTYTLPTGCQMSATVTVNAAPAAISGSSNVCVGATTPLFETTTGGTWSSSNTAIATVGTTGIVTGVANGIATVSYTTSTGCVATKLMNVNPLPSPITGLSSVCVGQTITLANPTPGGTWFSGSFTASADMSAGIVTGLTAGTTNITYRLPTGCSISRAVTIIANPSPITGSSSVCVGSTSLLTGSGGGTWSTSDPSIFSVDASGNILGIAAGMANVSYTLTANGCFVTAPLAINARPGINTVTGGGSYCATGAGVHIGLNGSFANVNYQIIESISGTYGATLAGSSAALDFGVFSTVGTYVVTARDTITGCTSDMAGSATVSINTPPTAFNVIGGGNYCIGTGGVHVQLDASETGVSYQLYNGTALVGSPMTVSAGVVDFGLQTVPGTYTVMASNLTTLCANAMTGSATVATNPLPLASNVMGGGNYCMGGAGSDVYISASDPSVNYTLYNGTTVVTTLAGTTGGGMLDFGNQTMAGVYTVIGSDATTYCNNNMTGSVTIGINPLPVVYTVTGGGNYCFGGSGVHVGLNNSSTGTTYTITGGPSVAGSNSGVDFGLMSTAGSYNVTAVIDATGCTNTMAGTAVVGVNPLPTTYSVIGGGAYCQGGAGSEILLDNSDAGISYQLYMGTTAVGPVVAGTGSGSPLSFGFQHAAGTYTIGAVNGATTCAMTMTGSQTVTINPNPTVYNVSRGANFCSGGAGVDITLDGSQNTVVYQLNLAGGAFGMGVAGTGVGPLDMGVQSVPGIYTVTGEDPITHCSSVMNGSSTINVNPSPAVYATTGGGDYCVGGAGRHVGLALSSVGINYTLTRPSGAPMTMSGTGFGLDFGAQLAPGAYTITAVNPLTSCSSTMTTPAIVNVIALPTAYTVTGSGQYCAGGAGLPVGISLSDSTNTYSLYNASGVRVAGPLTGINAPLSFGLITTTGTYTVKATDITYGCVNTMASNAVIVSNPLPSVYAVTGGGSFCAGGTGVHVGLSNANAGITYTATNGTFSTALTPSVNGALDFGLMTNGGTYTVSALNATTTCTSNMSGSKVVNVNPTVTPTVSIGGSAATCSGDVTTYTAVPVNGGTPTYAWRVNGGSVVSTSSTYSYAPTTADVVSLTMNSNAPCATTTTASGNLAITVTTKLTPSVSITTSGTAVCPGAPMTFLAAPVNGGTTPSYSWKVNGSPMTGTSSNTFVHNAAAGDVVFCVMTSDLTCRTMDNVNSNNIAENVDVPVTPEFTIVADPGSNIFKYSNVNFSLNIHVAGTAPTFAWKVNNGTTASTTATFSTANLRNNDTVSCTVISNSPCGTKSFTRTMIMSVSALGVNSVAEVNDFNILPNPNNGSFTVKGTLATTATEEVSIDVTNMLGQVVYTSKVIAQGGSINEQLQLSNSLANGMYLLNLHTSTGNSVFHFEIQK